jgi:hypothetical protein
MIQRIQIVSFSASFFLLFIFSCKSTQIKSTQKKNDKEPQIGFYYFEASRSPTSVVKVSLIKQKIVKGTLKGIFETTIYSDEWKDNNWLITLFDSNKKKLIQQQIHNPLIEIIEFINKKGSFEKRIIYHDKKEFVIRIPYNNSIKIITFEHITKDKKKNNTVFLSQIQL